MLAWIETTDFYYAPASTRFHGNHEGGLLEHYLNVYYAVGTKNVKDEATGQWHKEPFYKAEDQFPVGHGEKSVIILLRHMKLTDEEIYAIRWHMSGFDSAVKGGDFGCSKAYDSCPFAVLLHLADMEATYLMEERSV